MIVCPWSVTLRFPVLHEKPWSLVMPQIQLTGCDVKMVLFCFQLFMSCLINLQNEQILNEVSYHHNHDNPRRQHHHHYLNRHCSRHLIYHHFHCYRCHHAPRLVISIYNNIESSQSHAVTCYGAWRQHLEMIQCGFSS